MFPCRLRQKPAAVKDSKEPYADKSDEIFSDFENFSNKIFIFAHIS